MMRTVFDLQSAQQGASTDIAFSLALISLFPAASTFVILDGTLSEAAWNIRSQLERLLPQENIRTWHSPGPGTPGSVSHWRNDAAAAIREILIISIRPDAVIIPIEKPDDTELLRIKRFRSKSSYSVLMCVRSLALPKKNDLQGFREEIDGIAIFGRSSETLSKSNYFERIMLYADVGPNTDFAKDINDLIASRHPVHRVPASRPRLAFVTPVPPARSGISDYAVEMFRALAPYYNVTIIVEQSLYEQIDARLGLIVEDDVWFVGNYGRFDRIVYNFGNSPFHSYMGPLLDIAPGIVVMHEFFLGDLFYDICKIDGVSFATRLCEAHGYRPLVELSSGTGIQQILSKYPVNAGVVDRAYGLVVHSDSAKSIALKWFGSRSAADWAVIPLPRQIPTQIKRSDARASLNLGVDDFVVSSFGLITQSKQIDKLIEAWSASDAGASETSTLCLVGELSEGPYGAQISEMVRSNPRQNVKLIGWVDESAYFDHLAASDVAVQLRSAARGETSAAALDTMKCGIATIVNANGSMADLPSDAVIKIPDNFTVQELTSAIDGLFEDHELRRLISQKARAYVVEAHSAEASAAKMYRFIEESYQKDLLDSESVAATLAPLIKEKAYLGDYAESLALTLTPRSRGSVLFLDVSAIVRDDLRTGIQRVVRAIVSELLKRDDCLPIFPIYMSDEHHRWTYRYAHKWTLHEIGFENSILDDQPVEFFAGDKLLILDFTGPLLYRVDQDCDVYRKVKSTGVELTAVVYDILPEKFPDLFPWDAAAHGDWLRAVGRLVDRIICISKSVADDVKAWYRAQSSRAPRLITHFHLGADIRNSSPTRGVSEDVVVLLRQLQDTVAFLVVGTLEPRKRHSQILDAFEEIWKRGTDCHLVFVGKLGWMSADLEKRLDHHPERFKRLHWLVGMSDEELEKIYASAACIVAASVDEGFGLPLIEAAQHKVAIIARDIPVFREVAGPHCTYFKGESGRDLAEVILNWLTLFRKGVHQKSDNLPWLLWSESAEQLLSQLFVALPPLDAGLQVKQCS